MNDDIARATAKQLDKRYGVKQFDVKIPPQIVLIEIDGHHEVWVRAAGAGPETVYRLEAKTKVSKVKS